MENAIGRGDESLGLAKSLLPYEISQIDGPFVVNECQIDCC